MVLSQNGFHTNNTGTSFTYGRKNFPGNIRSSLLTIKMFLAGEGFFLDKVGTSDEWKGKWAENVLRNASINRSVHTINEPGRHTLKFWVIDPGVVLEKIIIDCGGLKPSYKGPGETRLE
jgi:hypothetical protein